MDRIPLQVRLQMSLARNPARANRMLGLLGERRVERAARKAAIQSARDAYKHVPFYRELYQRHGFDDRRMRRLTWADFQRLPTASKEQTRPYADADLRDARVPSPAGDAIIGRSSGTTGEPSVWPTGWAEFYVTCGYVQGTLKSLRADTQRTAVVMAMVSEGADLGFNLPFRTFTWVKERTRWPFEIFAIGEDPVHITTLLRWLVRDGYAGVYLLTFPGTLQALLDYLATLELEKPGAGVDWRAFKTRHVGLGGQVVPRALRDRARRDLHLDPRDLMAVENAYASSDTGQIIARSTPFTVWLEGFVERHPEAADALGIPVEHRGKPFQEFVPSIAVYAEVDDEGNLLLTTWKNRPLVRYRSNDGVWLRNALDVRKVLRRVDKKWRRDFKRAGYRRRDIPTVATLGIVYGRLDDVVIVNATNISPELLRNALTTAGILPRIHHFKHAADAEAPNVYRVYLELPDVRDESECERLADEWRAPLLDALVSDPANTDLMRVHQDVPIDLRLVVRARGQGEFAGDAQRRKITYAPRRSGDAVPIQAPAQHETP